MPKVFEAHIQDDIHLVVYVCERQHHQIYRTVWPLSEDMYLYIAYCSTTKSAARFFCPFVKAHPFFNTLTLYDHVDCTITDTPN